MANAMDADDLKHMPATEEAAAEVLDEIDVAYFVENQFDATNYELQKMLSSEFEIDELERERFKLKRQLQVVSKKVSALIMKKSAAFSNQVQHYAVIQQEAGGMVEVISGIRETLSEVRDQCRTALEIVANDRKRKLLRHLRLTLKTLKTLYETEFQLRELIQEGNFPTAIQLCVEAKNVTSQYNYFDCISDLSKNLSKTLESMESHIDDALAGLTVMFDYSRYSLVCSAYQMLNKTETAAAKLLSFFRATLESSSRGVLVELLTNRCSVNDTDKLAYEELCEAIPLDYVADSLRELGIVLCKVLRIYHLALQFHIEEDERLLCTANISEADLDTTPIIEKGAFQTALTDGLYSTFKTASTKYNALLCCHDLSLLKFDNFIEVVEMSNRFRKFGRTYFGNACGEVAMSLEKQTCLYFAQYHRERMGELKMFLENEVFALCPVPLQFTLFDLPEFYFLKESSDAFDEDDTRVHRLLSHNGLGEQLDFKLITSDAINPFYPTMTLDNDDVTDKIEIIGPRRESSMERSSSEESNYTDNPSMKSVMPNLCNTSLSVLRLTGRYIRMTSMLHSIADQAIVSIIQIFHFFFFAMCEYFSRDADFTSFEVQFTSGRLQRLIDSSRNSLFAQDATETNGELKQKCELSPCVDINSAEGLFALAERIVAIESACFLAKQLELLRPVLESLISLRQESKTLQNFYKEVVPVVVDLRQSAYGCVVSRAINYNQIAKLISQVNWEIGEIQSQHSAYVDFIYSELSTFSKRFKHCSELVNISSEVNNIIWNLLILCIFKTIVQGYSEYGKKCSNEGRALMLLDFEQIIRELESVTGIRPIPHKAFVEDYIKAYYLPDDCLNDWIAKHQEYTNTQLISLLNTASNMSKKAKSRLMNVLEGKESAA